MTCGAFYAHFRSKADAFRETIAAGLDDLRRHIEHTRQQHGDDWQTPFIDFYLGERRTCNLANSCTLQSLSSDVARADGDARQTYQASLRAIVETMTANSTQSSGCPSEQAISLLALLVGGVTFARAVDDPAISDEITAAIRSVALTFRTRYAAKEMLSPLGQVHGS